MTLHWNQATRALGVVLCSSIFWASLLSQAEEGSSKKSTPKIPQSAAVLLKPAAPPAPLDPTEPYAREDVGGDFSGDDESTGGAAAASTDKGTTSPSKSKGPGKPLLEGCTQAKANTQFQEAFRLQQALDSKKALESYTHCLKLQPDCESCLYERGWSYWKLDRWKDLVESWTALSKKTRDPYYKHQLAQFLPTAQENLRLTKLGKKIGPQVVHPKIGTESAPPGTEAKLKLIARFQSYNEKPTEKNDIFDGEIDSPKSVMIHPSVNKAYVNSLENGLTLVYDTKTFAKLATISHHFTSETTALFLDNSYPSRFKFHSRRPASQRNLFDGKPVEGTFTHNGKYLWVAYYRRNFDPKAKDPSAVAVIDTTKDEIVGVITTGPISKYVLPSPDSKWMAVSHWGDNTLSLIDISSPDFRAFKNTYQLVVEKPLNLNKVGVNRDKDCGFCIRGLAYSKDSRYLFVTRMRGGGVAVFDLQEKPAPRYLGSVFGLALAPRDLAVNEDGNTLYIGCNSTGYVTKLAVADLLKLFKKSNPGARITVTPKELKFVKGFVGLGARSMRLSPDEKHLYVSTKARSEVVVLDTEKMKVVSRIATDSFPVGLDVSPNGKQIWSTSQSQAGKGGNSINVFEVESPESKN